MKTAWRQFHPKTSINKEIIKGPFNRKKLLQTDKMTKDFGQSLQIKNRISFTTPVIDVENKILKLT